MSKKTKPVVGYEGLYTVTSGGDVIALEKVRYTGGPNNPQTFPRRVLKTEKTRNGYLRVMLSNHGVKKKLYVHRIVAEAFIPNEESKPQVNHKNLDKEDNRACNLEWVTNKENCQHYRGTM